MLNMLAWNHKGNHEMTTNVCGMQAESHIMLDFVCVYVCVCPPHLTSSQATLFL